MFQREERFVDLVARRQALIVQIRARIDTGNLDDAQKLFDDLRKLGTQRQFTQIIAQHQRKTVSRDKAVQKKITTLFDDTQQVVNRFLSEREIEEVARLLDEARQPTTAQPATASTQ